MPVRGGYTRSPLRPRRLGFYGIWKLDHDGFGVGF